MSEATEVNGKLRGELERIAACIGEDHPDLARDLRAARLDVCRLEAREHVVRNSNDEYQSQLAALREELGQCKGEYDRAVNRVSALQDELDACGDITFTEWMNEHGKEAMSHELGVEELMEGAFECGAKSMRRHLKQRLADAERRNAELLDMLRMAWGSDDISGKDCKRISAALNPKPEAASHDE